MVWNCFDNSFSSLCFCLFAFFSNYRNCSTIVSLSLSFIKSFIPFIFVEFSTSFIFCSKTLRDLTSYLSRSNLNSLAECKRNDLSLFDSITSPALISLSIFMYISILYNLYQLYLLWWIYSQSVTVDAERLEEFVEMVDEEGIVNLSGQFNMAYMTWTKLTI